MATTGLTSEASAGRRGARAPADRALLAGVLAELDRAKSPRTTIALARRFRVHTRRISEALHDLRERGHRITQSGDGHTLVRSLRAINPTIAKMRSKVREMNRAIRGMERGRPPQMKVPPTRARRAA
jgi:hypothetical protein